MANLAEIEKLAKDALLQYGLPDWNFKYDSSGNRRFGCCYQSRKLITLSAVLTAANSTDRVMETVLHEIAHAIVGCSNGHNEVWKAQMVRMGLKPDRCFSWNDTKPAPKGMRAAVNIEKATKGKITASEMLSLQDDFRDGF